MKNSPFEQGLNVMTKPWVAISYLSFIVLSFFYIDKSLAYHFHAMALDAQYPWLSWVTELGKNAIYIVLLPLLAMFFRKIRVSVLWEARCWFLWLCVLVPNVICFILKVGLGRARPELLFSNAYYGFYGPHASSTFWSCPSGHTTTLMGLVVGLTLLFPRFAYAFLVSGLLLVSTRVLLTDHFLSDVLLSGYLVIVEIGIMQYFLRKRGATTHPYYPLRD